jgi:general secretion pathway protein L
MAKKILGLDIQDNSLSAVLVNSGIKGNRLEGYVHIPFAAAPEDTDGLTAALDSLTAQLDITGSVCALSLPAEHVSFRNLKVPFKQAKKIRQILPFELEPTLPLPVENLVVDFHVIKTDGASEETDLIAAAMDIERLQGYMDRLARYAIDPEIVTVGGYAAAVCLARLAQLPENAMMLNVDTRFATLVAFEDGRLHLIRPFPKGAADSQQLKTLSQNVRRTLFAFEAAGNPTCRPDMIYLSGPAAGQNGFAHEMSQLLAVPARRTDLVRDIPAKLSNPPETGWKSEQMDNALALALLEIIGIKGLNFRKGPFAVKKRWAEHRRQFIRSAVLLTLLIVLMLANLFVGTYLKTKRLEALNTEINGIFQSTFPEVKKVVDPLQQMRAEIEATRKASLFPMQDGGGERMIDILDELSRRTPANLNVQFSRLVAGTEDSVTITGDTDTFNTVDAMKGSLEASTIFKEVTIVSTNKESDGNRIRFRLKIKL